MTVALFRLGFPAAPPDGLTLPRNTTRWLIMQKVRGHPEGLPLFVGTRFQVLFHSPLGVLFTFPSWYWFTIGQQVVLSLGGWSPQIPPGFHVPEGTQDTAGRLPLSRTGVSPSTLQLSSCFR